MIAERKISIVAIHGNGRGGLRSENAKPLFPTNINFLAPSLQGFNCKDIPQSNYSMKQYADWMANYHKDVETPRIFMGHGLAGTQIEPGGSFSLKPSV